MTHFLGYVIGDLNNLDHYKEKNIPKHIRFTKEQGMKYLKKTLESSLEDGWMDKSKIQDRLNHLEEYFYEYFEDDIEDDKVYSTYNDKATWDWWCFGGRFGGVPLKDSSYETQQASVSDIDFDKLKIPCCIVTPDGEWHAEADFGWWGMKFNTNKTWNSEAEALLKDICKNYPDKQFSVIDFHI